jgi:hypothetical protein
LFEKGCIAFQKAPVRKRNLSARKAQPSYIHVVLHQIAGDHRVANVDGGVDAAGKSSEKQGARREFVDQPLRDHGRHHLADAAFADQHLMACQPAPVALETVPVAGFALLQLAHECADFAVHRAQNHDHDALPV